METVERISRGWFSLSPLCPGIKIPGYDIYHPDGIYLIKNNASRSFLIERPACNYKPNVIGLIGVKFCFLIYNCFFEVGFCFLPAGGRRPKRGFLP